jgi:hypothetical protein
MAAKAIPSTILKVGISGQAFPEVSEIPKLIKTHMGNLRYILSRDNCKTIIS